MLTNPQPDDLAQRLSTIRRHLHGLTLAIDALEAEMLAQYAAPRSDAELAAQRAREGVYKIGPQEVKIMRE